MEPKDYWTDTLRRKEKAAEDRYFVEQDRRLIEQWRRRRPATPPTESGATPTVAPLKPNST